MHFSDFVQECSVTNSYVSCVYVLTVVDCVSMDLRHLGVPFYALKKKKHSENNSDKRNV